MPGNEVPENIHNFFEQNNSSQAHQSQVGGGNWPVLNNNPWIGTQMNGIPPTFNSKNYAAQTSDSERGNGIQSIQTPFGTNPTRSTLKPELIRSQPRNQQVNLDGYTHGSQGLQARPIQADFQRDGTMPDTHRSLMHRGFSSFEQNNAPAYSSGLARSSETPAYSSGLARSSERPEATEAAVSYNFLGGQQLMRNQHPGHAQPHPGQKQEINEMQLLQQHLMFKRLQEMHRQQQLQLLQQRGKNHNSQFSGFSRHGTNGQLPDLLSGMPINDASNYMRSDEPVGGELKLPCTSHMLHSGNMNLAQHSRFSVQGIPNGLMFPQDRGQVIRSMGFVSQQPDQSLYGTPVASTRGSLAPLSHFQGTVHDFMSTDSVGVNLAEKASMHSSAFQYIQGDQYAVTAQGYLQEESSLTKQRIQGKSMFEDAPVQSASGGATSGSFQQGNHFSPIVQVQKVEPVGPSQDVTSLDPTKEKLFFSANDDGNQDNPFEGSNDTVGGYLDGNPSQGNDYLSAFPSIQSGSWSALMQEAVEASSSDTGLNEEWSGLSFQKMELSSGNHYAVVDADSGKQHAPWGDGDRQNASSLTSRPFPLFNDTEGSPKCHVTPTLQTFNFSYQQDDGAAADAFHESFQQCPKEHNAESCDQQKQLVEGSVQMKSQLNNTSNGVWGGHMQEEQASSARSAEYPQNMQHPLVQQQQVPLLSPNNHPLNKSSGWNVEALALSGGHASKSNENDYQKQHSMNMEREHEGSMQKFGGSQVAAPYPNSAGGQERVESDTNSTTMRSEGPYAGTLAAIMDANNLKPNQEADQWLLRRQQANYGKHVTDTFLKNKVEKYHNQPTNSSQAWCSSIGNTDRTSSETLIRQQENSHKQELPNDGFNPSYLMSQQNAERNGPHQPVSSSLKSGQDGRENLGLRRFPFHLTGNLEMSMEPMDSQNHTSYSRSSQSGVLGLENQEQGYAGGTQFAGHTANTVVDIGQGHLTELKRNARAAEEIKSSSSFGNQSSVPSSDGAASPFEQNKRSGVTSENMLELFHKVDQSTVGNTTARFDFSPSEMLDGDVSEGSVSHFQRNQFSLQGIGLKLAPPSQQQSVDALPSRPSLKQTTSDIDRRNPESGVREVVQTWSLSPSLVQHLPPDHKASVGEKMGDKPFVHGKRSKEPMNSNSQGNSLTVAAHTLRMNQFFMDQQQLQQQQQQQQQKKISSTAGRTPSNQSKNKPSANKIDEGDKPFVHGNRSKEPIDSNSQGNSLIVTARTLRMNQFLIHQQQIQQQQQQQQPPPPPPQQQKISSATVPTPDNQSKNLPSANKIVVVPKQPFHTGKGHRSDMGFTDQSADAPPTRFAPSANNCVSVPSQSPVSAGHSQPVNSCTYLRSSGQQEASVGTRSAGQPSGTSAMSQQGGFSKMLNNIWTSVSSQRQVSGMQPQKIISNVLQSMSSLPSSRETNSLALQKVKSQKRDGESDPAEQGEEATSSQEMPPPERVSMEPKPGSASQGQEPDPKHSHDSSFDRHKGYDAHPCVSSSNHNTGPEDHSLRSSDLQKQNYSLMQQMQIKRAADSDPSRRDAKRLKSTDFGSESLQKDQRYVYGQNTILREMDARSQNVSLPSDMRMLSFSLRGNEGKGAKTSVQDTSKEPPSHDQVRRYQDIHNHPLPQGKSSALAFAGGSERPQISPQMAPSWFEQYGNFKNGQIATADNAVESLQRSANAAGQHHLFSKFSESMNQAIVPEQQYEASQVGSLRHDTSPTPVDANQYLASPHPPPLELTSNNMILIPKKSKSATEDLLPCHKEVTEGCQRLQSLSSTEWEWARATNRLVDKVEDEFEMIEDGLPVTRSRRRLILTTQLMQQILPSVPAAFLTADVTISCESVAYFCAKLTLRDACSVISWSGVDSRMDVDNSNKGFRKLNTKEKKGDNHFSKAVEDFIGRSRRLENGFLSLDRRASILDIRLECQELERSSIMNRFTKFHDRAQIEGGESTSTFGTARRTYPQRHVTALALRTDFPEGVIFLSL